jgi:hypothetical protein
MAPRASTHLPLLPTALTQRYHCADPLDTRFRAAARSAPEPLARTQWLSVQPLPQRQRPRSVARQSPDAAHRGDGRQPGRAPTDPICAAQFAYCEVGAFNLNPAVG